MWAVAQAVSHSSQQPRTRFVCMTVSWGQGKGSGAKWEVWTSRKKRKEATAHTNWEHKGKWTQEEWDKWRQDKGTKDQGYTQKAARANKLARVDRIDKELERLQQAVAEMVQGGAKTAKKAVQATPRAKGKDKEEDMEVEKSEDESAQDPEEQLKEWKKVQKTLMSAPQSGAKDELLLQAQEKVRELTGAVHAAKPPHARLQSASTKLKDLQEKLADLESQESEMKAQLQENQEEQATLKEEIKQAEARLRETSQ